MESTDTANESLQCNDKFCCMEDMIGEWDGAKASLIGEVRSGWKKFRLDSPSIYRRAFQENERYTKDFVYMQCNVYGSKTCDIKGDVKKLQCTEMSIVKQEIAQQVKSCKEHLGLRI